MTVQTVRQVPTKPMSERLQKLLAHAGLGSRREIEGWISEGRISVNGKRASLGDRATAQDRVLLDGRPLRLSSQTQEQIKAILYHKPEGEICTRSDPKGRPTIFENLPAIPSGRWVSVGRLDLNTSGLLLLTNSGDLANKLMHPSTGLEREYMVRVRGAVSDESIKILSKEGVMLDGRRARFDRIFSADLAEEGTNHWYRVVIKEGRYREVRRLWEAVGHPVSRLKRIRYGSINLPRDVKRGQHSKLAPKQLEKLVNSVGLLEEFRHQLYSNRISSSSKPVATNRATKRVKSADAANKNTHTRARSDNERNTTNSSDEKKYNNKKVVKKRSTKRIEKQTKEAATSRSPLASKEAKQTKRAFKKKRNKKVSSRQRQQ